MVISGIISPKKLLKMAKKWQKAASMRRCKRITFPGTSASEEENLPSCCSSKLASSTSSVMARKGHFVVYTVDEKRFEFPISYLNNHIIIELFQLSEQEFGLPRDGRITLPCNAASMERIVSLISRGTRNDKDLLSSRCPLPFSNQKRHIVVEQQLLVVCH